MSNIRLLKGDCLQKLKELKDNSVDSVVTDPPYHLTSWDMQPKKKYKRKNKGFMGKEWDGLGEDGIGIANNPELWKEVLRVLKPGGHLLSFSHSRTYHRQAVAVEDAGFEIRDQIMWIYSSGFPKSHNIGNKLGDEYNGIGTALKPAHEPIVMARKPFNGTVAKNVLEHGTGGINIDGCRVDNSDMKIPDNANQIQTDKPKHHSGAMTGTIGKMQVHNDGGRFPANIIFDEEAGKILDEQSGVTKSSKRGAHNNKKTEHTNTYTPPQAMYSDENTYGDSGGASRFFYCPKASKKDRNDGNIHPTVKPTDLMAYLVRLVTPKGGTVLDPFMGSGSTGKAAVREGFDFVGIEREDEYMEIAKTRIEHEQGKNKHREFFNI